MNTELYISSRMRDQTDIAILREGKLVELHSDSNDEEGFNVGDLYIAKVKKLVPSLNAAFVDVGYEKDAFLHYHDLGPQIHSLNKFLTRTQKGKQQWQLQDFSKEPDIDKDGRIEDILKTNQRVLVQIAKEPISNKGPRITSEISLAGRFLVLVPFSNRVSVSQKISSSEEKARLKKAVDPIRPQGFGIILRTVAEGKESKDLEADLRNLLKRWKSMHRGINGARPPQCIHRDLNRSTALLRDLLNDSFTAVHTDSEDVEQSLRGYLESVDPEKAKMVRLYNGKAPLFENFGVERQIKTSFGKNVPFAQGAYLIIEHTEAMHVIDVNSGNRKSTGESQEDNALDVNMRAAEEIARQLRLRDMGGIIVVDFIDLHKGENRKALFDKLKEEMKIDRAKHKILPPSRFGLVEITRQRVRPALKIETREQDPEGKGTIEAPITIISEIETRLGMIAKQERIKTLYLHVHPFVASYINQGLFRNLRKTWSKQFRLKLKVISRDSFSIMEFHFYNEQDVKYEF